MAEKTLIAWTDHTFNAWMGCAKVSAGCANCYAEKLVTNRMGLDLWGPHAKRQLTKTPWQNVEDWAKITTPGVRGPGHNHLVFLGSLMDWAEDRPDLIPMREKMWALVKRLSNLTFQMLTKRPENIAKFLPCDWGNGYPNVWLGTSIEDMRVAARANHLRQIPASVRFISYEPALGSLTPLDITGIDWVIYGGESGPGFRPEDKQWARDMHAKCSSAGAAFFHKQSTGFRTEMGIELDGKIVREYPGERLAIKVAAA